MKTEDLRKKVEAAEQKVEKCRKTIERHKQQKEKKGKQLREMGIDPETADCRSLSLEGNMEGSWLLSDYHQKQDDIDGAIKKLAESQRIYDNWKVKLDLQINQEMVIQNQIPQVIKDFLQAWKEKAFEWYVKRYDVFIQKRSDLRKEQHASKVDALKTLPEYASLRERVGPLLYQGDYYVNNPWPRQPMENYLKARGLDDKSCAKKLQAVGDGVIAKMCDFRDPQERLNWLDATLEEEKKHKMLALVARVTKITGPITDVRNLYTEAGDLNGYILGEKGTAKVQTISAGGYNIQCFHYRCLVDDVTQKVAENPYFQPSDLQSKIDAAKGKQGTIPSKNGPVLGAGREER